MSYRSIKLLLIAFILFLKVYTSKQESLCGKNPRPPPGGCCPPEYTHQCCPVAGENEVIQSCVKSKKPTSFNNTKIIDNQLNTSVSYRAQFDPKKDCVHSWRTQACAGGFYLNLSEPNPQPKPCPSGFFCPAELYCLIPCPSGAYCVPKEKKLERGNIRCGGFGVCCGNNEHPLIVNSSARKCNGLEDKNCLCGGTDIPKPCPGGYYCLAPNVKEPCESGYYCGPGSTASYPCPWLTRCKKKSSAPIINFIAPLIILLIVLTLTILLVIYQIWQKIKPCYDSCLKKEERSRMRIIPSDDAEIESEAIMGAQRYKINISFDELGLTLKSGNKKVVLQGVTGHIRSGEVTAVMGPSGAGKTTLLNTLSGKDYYGKRTGKILFNGEAVTGINEFRSITGFVPQEDTMHRNLKVKEVLYYQAMLRLPTETKKKTIYSKVDEILTNLKISNIADSIIGDKETRGISGGQRKKVNIAMELIADPTLLFLDEPTSGLDSTSSLSVMKLLRKLAEQRKLTVFCVIHQPCYKIFQMFHNILLLGPGGKTVYQGNVPDAKIYFSNLGFETPANVNPAEFYMDVIDGREKSSENENIDLFRAWNYHLQSTIISSHDEEQPKTKVKKRVLPNPFVQFLIFTQREFILQYRSRKTLLIDTFLVFFAGAVLGALYLEVTLEKFTGLTRMSGMAIGLTTMLASLRCFGNHRTTFWRESAAGVKRFSYFFAVNFAQIPILLIMPLVYLSLLYTLTSPRSYFVSHYIAVFCAQFCCSGIGYAISTIFNPKSSQMASVVVVLVMAMLSGSSPTLCKLDKLTFFGPLAYNLSFIRWFVEALFEKEALRYPDVDRPIRDRIAFQDHYSLDGNYSFCLGMIVIMAFVYRLFALLFLLFTNRGKQQ